MSFIDKIKEYYKKSPLAVLIVASAVVLSVIGLGVMLIKGTYKPSMTTPPVAGVFGGAAKTEPTEGVDIPTMPVDTPAADITSVVEVSPSAVPSKEAPTGEAPTSEAPTSEAPTNEATPAADTPTPTPTTKPSSSLETQYASIPIVTPRSTTYGSTGKKALTTNYDWITVDKSWFSDAVCIGDSRVEDFCLFSGINMDCYYDRGLAIFHLLTNKVIDKNGNKNTTITEVFSQKQYKKIYICEGLNECAYATTDNYYKQYKAVIEEIQKMQPNAIIYIMSTMYVTKKHSDKDNMVNNDNVNDKNAAVAALANGVDIFYIDINDADTTDSDGGLNPSDTEDGEHLAAKSVWKWDNYLKAHGVKDDVLK